ncbi:hypothetical protein GCM10010401_21440 [Rarobacter faecitabidus]|nr:SURF1 family protein [Rarobacter faecitabidus]
MTDAQTEFGGKPDSLSAGSWAILAALTLIVATACVSLGFWQWGRHEARGARNAVVEASYDQAPAPLSTILTTARGDVDAVQWRPVTLTGTYVGEPVLVRNRPIGLGSGFHVLGVLAVPDGSLIVVNRGYLATSLPVEQIDPPLPPAGEVTVVGRIRPAEPDHNRAVTGHQVYTFTPAQVTLAAGVGNSDGVMEASFYVVADPSLGPNDSNELSAIPRPETDQGPHLSYAFQWWTFAAGILGAFIVLFVRERRPARVTLNDLLDPNATQGTSRSAARTKGLDESAEDEEISHQLR